MLLYAITNRRLLPGDDQQQRAALIDLAARWAREGVDFIQVREKDLESPTLQDLATAIVKAVRAAGSSTRVLLNGPAQIALDSGCDGVHLPGSAPPDAAEKARSLFGPVKGEPVISAACHDLKEARKFEIVTMLLFSPVFEKKLSTEEALPGAGLDALRAFCRSAGSVPVVALGGVTWENAAQCLAMGATGIAGIRLFLDRIRPEGASLQTVQKPVR